MKEIIGRHNLKTKIFKSKYLFVKEQIQKKQNSVKKADLLIAPSWNTGFYKLGCHIKLQKSLSGKSISYKFRPHPMSYIKKEISKKELQNLDINVDESEFINYQDYDYFITDWSGLFIEYQIWSLIFENSNYTKIPFQGSDKDFTFIQLIVFIFLSIIVGQLKSSWVTSAQMIIDIRQGLINKYLVRPISYFWYHFMMFLGVNSLFFIVYTLVVIFFDLL